MAVTLGSLCEKAGYLYGMRVIAGKERSGLVAAVCQKSHCQKCQRTCSKHRSVHKGNPVRGYQLLQREKVSSYGYSVENPNC